MNGTKNSEIGFACLEGEPLGRFCACYSEIEGLQSAHTLTYCAYTAPGGAVLRLDSCESGRREESAVYCPGLEPRRAQCLLRYLYENGAAPGQWLDLLADLGLDVQKL